VSVAYFLWFCSILLLLLLTAHLLFDVWEWGSSLGRFIGAMSGPVHSRFLDDGFRMLLTQGVLARLLSYSDRPPLDESLNAGESWIGSVHDADACWMAGIEPASQVLNAVQICQASESRVFYSRDDLPVQTAQTVQTMPVQDRYLPCTYVRQLAFQVYLSTFKFTDHSSYISSHCDLTLVLRLTAANFPADA
jgi:hypothetical protein